MPISCASRCLLQPDPVVSNIYERLKFDNYLFHVGAIYHGYISDKSFTFGKKTRSLFFTTDTYEFNLFQKFHSGFKIQASSSKNTYKLKKLFGVK